MSVEEMVRPVIVIALILVAAAPQQVKFAAQPTSKPSQVAPKDHPDTWMVTVGNVSKDPGEEYGHGEGDSLTLIVHGETTLGALSELEGSQQDPSPICMTGSLRETLLHLKNYPADLTYEVAPIAIDGKLSATPRGHTFRGRITGGPFHSEPNATDPHFPSMVTLRSSHGEPENDPDNIADELANSSCACQWKKHVDANSFITAKCDSPAKNEK
jgi:hypothetical protein